LRSPTINVNEAEQITDFMIPAHLTGTHGYQFDDATLSQGGQYYYWLQQFNHNQPSQIYGPITIFVDDQPTIYLPLINVQ